MRTRTRWKPLNSDDYRQYSLALYAARVNSTLPDARGIVLLSIRQGLLLSNSTYHNIIAGMYCVLGARFFRAQIVKTQSLFNHHPIIVLSLSYHPIIVPIHFDIINTWYSDKCILKWWKFVIMSVFVCNSEFLIVVIILIRAYNRCRSGKAAPDNWSSKSLTWICQRTVGNRYRYTCTCTCTCTCR